MGCWVAVISNSQNDYGAAILRFEVITGFSDVMLYTLMLPNADRNRTVIKTAFGYIAEHAEKCDESRKNLSLLRNKSNISLPLGGQSLEVYAHTQMNRYEILSSFF